MSTSGEGEHLIPVNNNNNINGVQTFACQTCGKPFVSVQALGGHQNAHRSERFAMKRRQIEMRRQLARQSRPMLSVGPAASWTAAPPGYVMNSSVVPPDAVEGADVAADDGIDLTLRL